jgi:arylsulfatase A-like enzyme
VTVRSPVELFRAERWHPAANIGLASAAACAVALIACKLVCVGSVAATELGRDQLAAEVTALGVLGWFGADLVAAVAWGALAGVAFGFARRRRARAIATGLWITAHAALALALLVAAEVYVLFGVQPSWQLLGAFDAGNAADSVADLLRVSRVLLWLGLTAVLAAGAPLLARAVAVRRRLRLGVASAIAGLLVLLLAASALAPASRFELDRNPLLGFARSALVGPSFEPAVAAGEYADVLAPVAGHTPPDANLAPYLVLRKWAQRRPNVVLIVLESTAARHLGVTGGAVDNTPNLSRLAGRALMWTRHYANTPNSMFALYELLCSNHGRPQQEHISRTRPRIDCGSLSEIFAARGYRAALFHSGRFSYSEKDRFFGGRGYSPMYDALSVPNRERYHESSWGIEEAAQIDAMLDWVRKADEEPFFLTYIPVYPHHPYDVPHSRYKILPRGTPEQKYENAMLYVDTMVGELLAGFDEVGVADDTLFVILGDHGESFGEHPGSRMHGSKLYDEAVHTFVLWYAPGLFAAGHRDDRPFSHVDVAPTLLELLGIERQSQHVGLSALRTGKRPMVPLYTGYGNPFVAFVDGNYKFIHNRKTGVSELYDVVDDPREKRSLVADNADSVEEYRQRVAAFVSAQLAWEARLPDLESTVEDLVGPEQTVVINPVRCEYPADYFEVTGAAHDELLMNRGGLQMVRCEAPLPPEPAQLTAFELRGAEMIAGSKIVGAVLWETPDGNVRQVAHCTFNGSHKHPVTECRAELLPELTRLGGGGVLAIELRYKLNRALPPFERFGVKQVEARYRVAR